ncbi:MAG: WD40 repeat domain-containing protein, partial [Pseudomonadota bacterium]
PQSIRQWRGNLLAPDEPQSSWFRRSAPAAPPDELDPGTQPLAKTRALGELNQPQPQPDAPAPEGQFVDFVDRLKRRNQDRDSNVVEDAEAITAEKTLEPATAGKPDTKTKKRATGLFQLGWGARRKPTAATAAPAEAVSASVSEEQLPVVVPQRPPPRVLRKTSPRPIRGLSRPRWRPLLVKLIIGFGIAAGVVALQDRMPQFATRTSGTISSSSQANVEKPAATKKATAPAAQAQKPQPLIDRFQAHDAKITNLAYADDGRLLVTTGADGLLKVWNANSRTSERVLELDDGPATALATYRHFALTGHPEGVVVTWDLRTGFKLKTYQRNKAEITAVAFAGSESRFWVASRDWTMALWEARTPSAPLHVLKGHDRPVLALAYNDASGLLMSGSADRRAKIWRTADYKLLRTYSKSRDFISAVTLSASGNRLASGSLDGRIRTMSPRSRRYREIRAHSGTITGLKFNPNGATLLSASADGTVKVWGAKRRRPLATYTAGGQGVTALAAASDGSQFMTGSARGEVRVWRGYRALSR